MPLAAAALLVAVLLAAALALASYGPWSPRAAFRRDAAAALAAMPARGPGTPVTEADLAALPEPVRRWLRRAGVVGRPPIRALTARFRGQLRGGPEEPWMAIEADEVATFDPPARLFLIRASRGGVPFVAYHRYVGPAATFQVRIASAFTVVDARGPEMDRSETVTLLNDLCLLAPSTLPGLSRGPGPALRWEAVDARTARVAFGNAGHEVRAELRFDEAGDLADFVSDDRSRASPDGTAFERLRWSTPVRGWRAFGPWRLPALADARWHPPAGPYQYARFELVALQAE